MIVDFFCGNLPTGRQVCGFQSAEICEKKKKEISRRGSQIKSQSAADYDQQNSPEDFKRRKKGILFKKVLDLLFQER